MMNDIKKDHGEEEYNILLNIEKDRVKRYINEAIQRRDIEGEDGEYSLNNTLDFIKEVHGEEEYKRIKNIVKQ